MKYLHLSSIRSIFNNVIKTNYRQSVLCAATVLMLLCFGAGEMWGYYVYLYTGDLTGWEDANATFQVYISSNHNMTALGGHWFRTDVGNETGTAYIKRLAENYGTQWNQFSASSVSSTNNVFKVTDWGSNGNSEGSAYSGHFTPYAVNDGWAGSAWEFSTEASLTDFNNWVYTKTYSNVSNSENIFRISTIGWTANWNYNNYSASTHPNLVSIEDKGSTDHNIGFTPAMNGGTVTITFNAAANTISITCQAPLITFDMEGGSGGTSSQNTYYNEATSSIIAPTKANYDFGGYWTGDNGTETQVIGADGAWIKNVSDYTDNSSTAKWIVRANHTLYAKWTPKTYSITYKDQGDVDYSGSNSSSLPSSYTYGTGIATLTNGLKSGYSFDGWFTTAACTGDPVTTISSSDSGAKTFYAKWTENPGGTVTLTAGTGGQVSKDGSAWAANQYYTGVKTTTPLAIYAQANTGYTFTSWTRTSGTGTIASTTTANTTYTPVANADATLTANFTERMSTLNTSCHYDAGNPSYAAPTVSGSATNVGYSTTRTITATAAGTGYTFAGWTLTNCTRTDGGTATATSITIRSNGDGAAATAQANYTEDLSSDWHLLGATTPFGGWTSSASNMLQKPSGSSTGSVANCTISVSALPSAEEYTFKLYNSNTDKWRTNNGYWVTRVNNNPTLNTEGGNNNELIFKPDIAGDYIFSLNYSGSDPVLTVTFPTSYTVNFGVSPAGAADAPTNDKSLSDGALVLSGTSVTFTKDATPNPGYTWGHWDVGGSNVGTENTYTANINAATTVTAVYTENTYSTNVVVSPTGKGSITSPTPSEGKINVSHHTGTAVTATANTNYIFESWSVTGGGLTVSSATNNPATFKATSAGGTITANFADQWAVCGIGSWSTFNGLPLKSGTVYEGTIALTAGSHTFKVVDRKTNTWYTHPSKTITRAANTASATTTTGENNNITITADRAGDYTFTFDTSDQSLTVTYPTDPTYTVTVNAGAHGSITTPASPATTVSAGEFTPADIMAVADDGYVFSRWTVTSGEASDVTITDATAASTTITATGAVTLTATFISTWAITGSSATFGEWSTTAFGFSNFGTNASSKDTCYIEFDLPANTDFTFKIYNHLGTGDKWYGNSTEETYYMTYAANNDQNWEFHEGNSYKDCGLTTAGAGTYRFIWNITDEMLRVRFPESYTVTFGSSTGGTEVTASGSTSGSITTGQYVAADENVTFTQTPATGYTFSEWNAASDGSGTQLSTATSYTLNSIAANSTVYAKYNTIPYTVSIAYMCGGTTLTSSTISANVAGVALVAPDIIGYSFTGWTAADGIRYGASYAGGTTTSSEASTTLYATKGAAITANYAEHKAVYFKNTLGWSEVYVTYDAEWNETYGTGNDAKCYHKMTRIGATDIYYDYIPSGYVSGTWAWNIAFNNTLLGSISDSDGDYEHFNSGQVIFRKDFDKNATMFVPRTEGSSYTKNGATYVCSNYTTVDTDSRYADSYWMVYNSTESGYKLSINKTTNPWTGVNFDATTAGMSEFTATIELAAGQTYSFCVDKVTSVNTNNHWFANNITVTKDNCTNVEMYSNPSGNCPITTTAAGNYTFTLTCGNGRLFLSVDYPLSTGDYRLVYTHDGHSKPSDIIRANPGTEKTVSFYIKNWTDASGLAAQSLKLQRCTAVSPESWGGTSNEWDVTSLLDNKTLKDTSGVYNFKVSQPSPSGTPTVTYEGGYKGNFYIRTDAADGGWNAYKDFADNRLTYSEYSEKNSNYSHYFMKYVTAGKNIKFCIANDYSQCISDTLEGDTYTGNSQTLPVNANIRYTWNHETNAITRAYIGASAASDFLRLHGDDASNKLYTAATGDTYNTAVKFADDENWIYHVDVFAVPNTRIKLTANWNSRIQYFKGSAPIDDFDDADDDALNALAPYLIGGSGSTRFKMRVIYDFKTNRLTTAWLPDGENITTATSVSADLLVIRDADSKNAPSLFTLSASGKVDLIGHIVFALEMNPATIFDDSHTTYRNGLRSQLFQVCLPYDVNVNDIYGLPGYGTKWVIQTYSGEMRAKLSWTPYIKDFWGTVRLSDGGIIKAGTGFVISHNLQYEDFRNAGGAIDKLYLYFPSVDKVGGYTINQPVAYGTTTYAELKCNHTGRESIDSDWRLTGLPGFYPAVVSTADPASGVQGERDGEGIEYNHVTNGTTLNWLYEWGGTAGNYIVKNPKEYALNPTSAYFIQYHGSVTWTGGSYSYDDTPATPASVAAHRAPLSDYTNAAGEYIYSNEYVLTLNDADAQLTDQAYVVVEPDATQGYTRNEDLGKSFAQNAAQIYTLSEGYQLAANTLPDTVTAVKVCLDMPSEGEYTIRLEKGGQLNHAVLEDLYTMTSTNLNTSEGYTFAAEAGRTEDRFVLRFAPQQPGTATDTETATAGTLRVTVIDGQIIVENGAKTGNTAGDMVYLYDAAGKAIYSTPFREGMTFPAPSAAGIYLVRLGSESRRIVVGK